LQYLLSTKLYSALVAFGEYESACGSITPPSMKPNTIDDTPFYYNVQKGASAILSVRQTFLSKYAKVSARLQMMDVKWTDTVILAKEAGQWVIFNIQFAQGGSLISSLADALKTPCIN
jgi:hypothetical protein